MSEKEVKSPNEKEVKPSKRIQIKILELRGASALVEYVQRGKLVRKVVPVAELQGNMITLDALKAAQDYGDRFDVKLPTVTKTALLDELHRAGIWTAEDLLKKSHLAQGCLMRLLSVPALQALINYSREVVQ